MLLTKKSSSNTFSRIRRPLSTWKYFSSTSIKTFSSSLHCSTNVDEVSTTSKGANCNYYNPRGETDYSSYYLCPIATIKHFLATL